MRARKGGQMKGHITMSGKERERLKLFERVKRGELKLKEAAELARLSYRQCRRAYRRYRTEGDQGLVHGGRGRASNRGYAEEFKQAVLRRYEERYPDFGPTLAAEKLVGEEYTVDHETFAALVTQSAVVASTAKAIAAPQLARAASAFWRTGATGWIASSLVRGAGRKMLFDEHGGRRDWQDAFSVCSRRDQFRRHGFVMAVD